MCQQKLNIIDIIKKDMMAKQLYWFALNTSGHTKEIYFEYFHIVVLLLVIQERLGVRPPPPGPVHTHTLTHSVSEVTAWGVCVHVCSSFLSDA